MKKILITLFCVLSTGCVSRMDNPFRMIPDAPRWHVVCRDEHTGAITDEAMVHHVVFNDCDSFRLETTHEEIYVGRNCLARRVKNE
jgi:hypothetical protein